MTHEELLSTYKKVRKVIRSCRTVAQLNISRKYAQLFMKVVPANQSAHVAEELTRLIKRQKRILWLM